MPLRYVAELVRHDGGQLIGTADHGDQAGVYAKIAARQREGVNAPVTHQHHVPSEALFELVAQLTARPSGIHQRLPDALHIVAQHRVVNVVGVSKNTHGNAVAQPPLARSRELGAVTQ